MTKLLCFYQPSCLAALTSSCRQKSSAPLKSDNCLKESNNKVSFYTLLTTLMCNHKARGGERGRVGGKTSSDLP